MLTTQDLYSLEHYSTMRADFKRTAVAHRRQRQVRLGDHMTLHFEDVTTIQYQIQEMLRIEKGGEAQLADELSAYEPMVPKGSELTCTMLIEIGDAARRDAFLRTVGGIENHIAIEVGGHVIRARPEGDIVRTRESDGKASAVHFFHFDFPQEAVAAWRSGVGNAMLLIDHPNYGHAAIIGADARAFLARECF